VPASMRNSLDFAQAPGGRLTYLVLSIVLLVYAMGVLTLPLLSTDEQIALGLLLLAPAVVIAVYIVTRALLGDRACGVIIAVMSIFIIAANFRSRAYEDKSIDWQVGIKMLAIALVLGMAIVFLTYAFNRLRLGRVFYAWLLFSVWLIVCSLYAVSVPFALACSIAFLAIYCYAVYMTIWLTRERTIEIMMFVALLISLGSIFVYYAVPSMGRMQAWMQGVGVGDTGRMKGLTGAPNGMGMLAGFAIIFAILYYREVGVFGKRLAFALIPSASVCLVLSNNRAGMAAVAVVMGFNFLVRGGIAFKLLLSITGALVGGAFLVSFSDEIFSMLSRSGRAMEITSLTGRSSIWAVVIELWAQRPIFGHGLTSALWILPTDPRLFESAKHTHNMLLELLFAGGIVLLSIFLYATYQTLVEMYRLRAITEATLFLYFLVRGLTEPGSFGGMAGYTTFAFTVTIALLIAKIIEAREKTLAVEAVTATLAARERRLSRA
jgi:O-antigen ligase